MLRIRASEILIARNVVIQKSGSKLNRNGERCFDKISDLAGLKVGVQEATSGDIISTKADSSEGYSYVTEDENGEEITVTVKSDIKEISRYKQYSLAFMELKNGRIDAIVMDKLPALRMLNLIG